MTKKTLYIIRHGETDLNKAGIVQGRGMNTDLNDTGRKQGEAFYKAYKNVPFDKIYTSTLKRTNQTVKHFIDSGIPWQQLAGLDEMAWGDYEGKAVSEETRGRFKKIMQSWKDGDLDVRFENGESPNEVQERQKEAMKEIMGHPEETTVLICMHGRAMRLLLCLLNNRPLTEMDNYPHRNTTLYRVNFDGEKFHIEDFNNTDHLKYLL
ncbi:histidine phosphatase family protein [Mucilaginibacter arboris]|uniref:Histidine phosphatase family protein n=1 Tax=Mucilaginibacter arboris TaxID=2682090 RepID=A0A7K1SXE7_9SPHI|nr:histidine phosphatase family protein [Mucilaginibacter arboris]MVN21999.1 histidine phosphatase family protein [Mucilaginibacter arboris]